jgi:hypothetical protein
VSAPEVAAVAAGFLGLRWAWRSWRIRYHARARDYHENALYQLLRRFW